MHGDGAGIDVDRHAEGFGDAIGRDVVVRRADAAGGEEVGVPRPERVDRFDDLALLVRHDPDLAQIDADIGQMLGDVADVLVLGAPGEDFVADDEKGGGDRGSGGAHHWALRVRFREGLHGGRRDGSPEMF